MSPTKPNGKKIDRRVLRTRKAIMKAFDKLVSEGNGKITVSAIAREADIDRKTFYLHYKSVDELVNYKAELFIQQLNDKLVREGDNKTHLECVHLILDEVNSILTSNITLYTSVMNNLSTDQVLERFGQAIQPALRQSGFSNNVCDTEQQPCTKTRLFLAGAIFLYAEWLRSDHSEPIETISTAIEDSIAVIYAQWARQDHTIPANKTA